ncbi:MAG: T9SS type A sorting domain-containing protein [Elusimicrobia bacterium]|nr:T9SS type A sorting domain-containing protein [Elusimicrobiota bacterium]
MKNIKKIFQLKFKQKRKGFISILNRILILSLFVLLNFNCIFSCPASSAETDSIALSVKIDVQAPDAISDLVVQTATGTQGAVFLNWTEPGNDGTTGTAAQYLVRYSSQSNINNTTDFDAATVYNSTWTPGTGGSIRAETITGLNAGVTYYFAIRAQDSVGFTGTWSRSDGANPFNFAKAWDVTPTNLVASSISTNSITWAWTDNNSSEDGFRIYSSTGGIMGSIGASLGIGTTQFVENNNNLTPNTTYARYVKSFTGSEESLASNTTARYTLSNPVTGSSLANTHITSTTVSWAANNNPSGTPYQVQYSSYSAFTITSSSVTSLLSAILQNIQANTTYYIRVRSQNNEGTYSDFDTTLTTMTLPSVIENLTATSGDQKVTLDWGDSTESNHAGYFIYRSNSSTGTYSKLNASLVTTSDYEDTGLTNGNTYYYKVSAVNNSNLESPFSNIAWARAKKPAGPMEPTGILGSLSSNGQFTINWSPVTKDTAGSSRVELAAYRLYKSNSIDSTFTYTAAVSSNTHSWTSPDLAPPTVWYLVRSIDISDNESINSMRIETTASPTLGVATKDETIHIKIPASQASIFSASKNNLSEDVRIVLDRKSEDEKGTTLTSYEIKTVGANSGTEIKELKIKEPIVEVQLRYTQGTSGSPLPVSSVLRAFPGSPRDVGIFWHNGVEFVKFGGAVNEAKGTVSIKTSKPTGKFQVRQVLRATEFTLTQLTPRKIFTPNGDGVNDEIILFLENPKESTISQAKIYDIGGAEVADFEQGFVANNQGIVSLTWNGRDHSGVIVRSGIYIYQVQAEGKVINGTIVVAR